MTVVMSWALAGAGEAQAVVPDTNMIGIGGDVGVLVPTDPLEPAVTLAAFVESYLSPRTSVRVAAGWADPGFDRDPSDTLHQVRLTFDLLYNWEEGVWHPFVGAGAGVYLVQETDRGRSVADRRSKGGINLGGGIEYFTRRTLTIKAEALYHFVAQGTLPVDPSGLTLTIGLKRYF